MGAPDFLEIARNFHTIFLTDIPRLQDNDRDAARRLIVFIDAVYENRILLICSADCAPHDLFAGGTAGQGSADPTRVVKLGQQLATGDIDTDVLDSTMFTGVEEAFQFRRAVSRLAEMQGERYYTQWKNTHSPT